MMMRRNRGTHKLLALWSALMMALLLGGAQAARAALNPVVQTAGQISLSVDGLGTAASSGVIQVEKPAGATVRGAYLAAASMGSVLATLNNGDIKIDGAGIRRRPAPLERPAISPT